MLVVLNEYTRKNIALGATFVTFEHGRRSWRPLDAVAVVIKLPAVHEVPRYGQRAHDL